MNRQEAQAIREIVEMLLLLIHNEREIAGAIAKHQNAPGYLHRQSQGLKEGILDLLQKL